MTLNAERVTFTKKKKTVACPVPLAPLADTHAHLLSFWGKDVPETLVRAKAAGIDLLVTVFDPIADKRSVTDYSDWLVREILPMQDIPQIKYLAGVHPYGAPDYTDDIHAQVVAALDDPLCAGIGEIGLDYYWEKDERARARQQVVFARQMELARELKMPVIVHDRDAHADCLEITRRYPDVTGVYHCYAGHVEMARELLERGYYLSFTGVITFKNAKKAVEVIREVPIERLMIETDSPYMAPEPHRGTRNDSSNLSYVAARIAEIKGVSVQEVEQTTWENACRVFGVR